MQWQSNHGNKEAPALPGLTDSDHLPPAACKGMAPPATSQMFILSRYAYIVSWKHPCSALGLYDDTQHCAFPPVTYFVHWNTVRFAGC